MSEKPYRGGCVKGMPVGRDGRPGCHAKCLHRSSVQDYRDSRHAWEEARENSLHMQMEDDEYRDRYPPPTFKRWLQGLAGMWRDEEAS